MSQSSLPSPRPQPKISSLGSMDPRASHSLRFTIEPYSATSGSYDLSYAFWQRELNEMREMIEQVQNELRDLKHIVQNTNQLGSTDLNMNPPRRKPQRCRSPLTPTAMVDKDYSFI